jgi:uncharacterized protein YjbJ (UPF0337 family)
VIRATAAGGTVRSPRWFCHGPSKRERKTMTGTGDKVKGAIKEAVGKVTGDRRTEAEGKTDRAKGEVKDTAHDAKNTVRGVGDSLTNKDDRRP